MFCNSFVDFSLVQFAGLLAKPMFSERVIIGQSRGSEARPSYNHGFEMIRDGCSDASGHSPTQSDHSNSQPGFAIFIVRDRPAWMCYFM